MLTNSRHYRRHSFGVSPCIPKLDLKLAEPVRQQVDVSQGVPVDAYVTEPLATPGDISISSMRLDAPRRVDDRTALSEASPALAENRLDGRPPPLPVRLVSMLLTDCDDCPVPRR